MMNGTPQRSIVIGASGGLGRAIAAELAARGDRVGLVGRDRVRLGELRAILEEKGQDSQVFRADVLDPPSLETAMAGFAEWSGGLDHLVFAAGRFRGIGPISECDPEEWRLDLETSLVGAMNSIRLALPLLKQSATPSIAVLVGPGYKGGLPFGTGYSSAQAGLVRLVESVASELASSDIPVFAVFPGLAPSGLTEHLLQSKEGRTWLHSFTEAFAEGKEVDPEVVAEMVGWLSERRPRELSGRVTFAPITPDLLEGRLADIAREDRHRLRLS